MLSRIAVLSFILLVAAINLSADASNGPYNPRSDSTYFESDLDMYFVLNYTYDSSTVSRFILSLESTLGKNVYYEIPFTGLTWISNDKYNHNKCNYSLIPTLGFALMAYTDELLEDKLGWVHFHSMEIATILLNSNLYYPVLTFSPGRQEFVPFFDRNYDMHGMLKLYLVGKLENDWFMFRRNQWFQTSPGAGLRLEYGNRYRAVYFQSGYESDIRFAQNHKPDLQLNPFFKAGFVINIASIFPRYKQNN